jgi:hypothetical protein
MNDCIYMHAARRDDYCHLYALRLEVTVPVSCNQVIFPLPSHISLTLGRLTRDQTPDLTRNTPLTHSTSLALAC